MKKLIVNLDENFKKHEDITKKILKKLEKLFDLKTKYIEVYLVGNKFMEKNVLSFPAPKEFPRPDIKNYETLGEIYLNPIYIENHNEDFMFMLVHGFLHLLGYDHKIKSDAMIMEQKENEIMAKLNLANGKQ
ncbi:MAG: rRNA maturation RNase YbeY [Patescibacteria group bacterium]